jgi:signal transduction histidine kinase
MPIILLVDEPDPAIIQRAIKAGATDYLSHRDGPQLIQSRINLFINHQQKIHQQAGVIEDLCTRKQNYERIVRMMIHDLKQPVTNIAIISDLLRRLDDPTAQEKILNSLDAANESIQEILDYFAAIPTITGEKTSLKITPVDVGGLLNEIVLGNFSSAFRKGMALKVSVDSVHVQADHDQLNRVVNNLVSNAIKYAPLGSTILVESEIRDGSVRISVIDEGPGIPPEEQHLLFQEFGKLSTQPTGEETSTGLGLWIVKKLTQAMGGTVGVDAGKSQGATFWVELPLAKELVLSLV